MPEAEQGLNVARIASLRAGIPGQCLGGDDQPILLVGAAGDRVRGRAHHVWSGIGDHRRRHRVDEHGARWAATRSRRTPRSIDSYPDVYLSTGLVAENHARESGSRARSRTPSRSRAISGRSRAIDGGRFAEEIVPVTARLIDGKNGNRVQATRSRDSPSTKGRAATHRREALAQLQAGVPRPRLGDGWQFLADERRRRRSHRRLGRAGAPERPGATWHGSSHSQRPVSSPSGSASGRFRRCARF